ncbi:AarF/UbiB family protein [Staphylococcus hominis]|uniref:AarF/UbiB family protein n=1 Tax=Staphylococcus hominis TaxID=1290 RepID=UPI003CFCCD29
MGDPRPAQRVRHGAGPFFASSEPVLRSEADTRLAPPAQCRRHVRPIDSASPAQVHAATRADDRPVIVKIQRSGIALGVGQDVALLRNYPHAAKAIRLHRAEPSPGRRARHGDSRCSITTRSWLCVRT